MKQQLTALVLGEVPREVRGKVFPTHDVKSAPHYFRTSVPHQVLLNEEKRTITGHEVLFTLTGFPHDVLVIRATTVVTDLFATDTFDLEDALFKACYDILKKRGGNDEMSEMYSIFTVSGYEYAPEQFLENHGAIIASLLKSERPALDEREVARTLATQIKYEKNDLAIIDWDGAFLFDPDEKDIAPAVELLTLANRELLRHRILDRCLDESLERIQKRVQAPLVHGTLTNTKTIAEDLRHILKDRMDSISKFQSLEREVKLIGDWYSARFYGIVAEKMKFAGWRATIKDKMDSIEDVYAMVAENFAISGKHRAEWIQIILFFVLQAGWFTLLVIEFLYFTR